MRTSLFFLYWFPIVVWANEEITVPLLGGESMEFVRIEPGTFLMGTSQEQKDKWDDFNSHKHELSFSRIPYSSEFPQHPVSITKTFYLGKYEVSRSQWFAVMDPDKEVAPFRLSITNITWLEIQDYLAILNEKSDLTFRLPTESEWEYAARAGTTTLWWFGDDPIEAERIIPGSSRPNPWGLYNIIGGVHEFIRCGFRNYAFLHEIDPVGPHPLTPEGKRKAILRGGDNGYYGAVVEWPTFPHYTRSAYRMSWDVDRPFGAFGFRVLLEDHTLTGVGEDESWGGVKKSTNNGSFP